jgi:hypothetical protein
LFASHQGEPTVWVPDIARNHVVELPEVFEIVKQFHGGFSSFVPSDPAALGSAALAIAR